MSNQYWGTPAGSDVADTNTGMAGAAPSGAAMQGNPDPHQNTMVQVQQPPEPQNSSAQLAQTQMSNGNVPMNVQPTNVSAPPGTDSALAMMARGQLSLNQSNYGQGGYTPVGGAGQPNSQSVAVAQVTGQASGITLPSSPSFVGT